MTKRLTDEWSQKEVHIETSSAFVFSIVGKKENYVTKYVHLNIFSSLRGSCFMTEFRASNSVI